jgi:hypothetical protein
MKYADRLWRLFLMCACWLTLCSHPICLLLVASIYSLISLNLIV